MRYIALIACTVCINPIHKRLPIRDHASNCATYDRNVVPIKCSLDSTISDLKKLVATQTQTELSKVILRQWCVSDLTSTHYCSSSLRCYYESVCSAVPVAGRGAAAFVRSTHCNLRSLFACSFAGP